MRLDKFLAGSGIGSRKEVKELLKKRRVAVNGQCVSDGSVHIQPTEDQVEVDGQFIGYKPFLYVMMNKPAGVLSATEDSRDPTVIDLLPEEYLHFHPFPAGRLDKDTQGLLLITNDGELTHRLLSPKKKVPKVYLLTAEKQIGSREIEAVRQGIYIKEEDYTTMPGELKIVADAEHPLLQMTIYEGKFHQVKRMMEALENKVLALKRIEFAGLVLDETLSPGQTRELTEKEIEIIKEIR